ncbi:protein of unknown function DUF1294 [Caldalkalibacillus thermarum TA2.A1]|uniref:DUF1294 domain-containing protein n=1 Tax=Caldalkalibacillus thermarum (strain TA2.A1) TaxID=986075 RepID=F5L386_CALTT|nr:DUF1294 domain-containing protein [Caldalkalibacillus thermarum]EGL84203.1 protein of unknown function DUF1294 [Caldalkalibacillus thermarum TA2.A1]QZT32504.1 DUF1294 domain-containing protein [Caldalkalibacillus thermarum TA2.A1]
MYLWILLYFAMINLIGYIIMWRDKRAAQSIHWRISEKLIFQIALAGGAAGIYVGMRYFRHKTQKLRFKIGIPFLVVLNAGCLVGAILYLQR